MSYKHMEHFYDGIHGWFSFPKLYSRAVEQAQDGAKMVEVGSWHGRSAAYLAVEIVNSGKQIVPIFVDSWRGDGVYTDYVKYQADYSNEVNTEDGLYESFCRNMEPVKHMMQSMRMTSEEAATQFADESLDFVFIDASHEYEDIKRDLRAWYPKVKHGGTMGGHDYPSWEGVQRAVDEYITEPITKTEECWVITKVVRDDF
jgi:hypothetical protein